MADMISIQSFYMKCCIVLFASLMLPFYVQAQPDTAKKRVVHAINISYTPQWFPNSRSIIHEGIDNNVGQVLYPKQNMPGHTFGVEYQFTGKKGLILSLGMQQGVQNHEVDIKFNIGYVDESQPLYAASYVEQNHKARIGYKIARVMAGYRWEQPFKFLKQTNIEIKAGIGLKFYDTVERVSNRWLTFIESPPGTYKLNETGFQYVRWGSKPDLGSDRNYTGELYVGLSRHIGYYVLQSVSFGIEATTGIRSISSGYISEELYLVNDRGIRYKYSSYTYAPKDFGLGIRLAIGLGYWPGVLEIK